MLPFIWALLLLPLGQDDPGKALESAPDGKARIVFYRSGSFHLGGRGCSAFVDRGGKPVRVAELGRRQYAVFDSEFGPVLLSGSKSLKKPLVVELTPGSTMFVRCEVAGIMGHSRLVPVHRLEFERYAPDLRPAR